MAEHMFESSYARPGAGSSPVHSQALQRVVLLVVVLVVSQPGRLAIQSRLRTAQEGPPMAKLTEGVQAPTFTLPDQDGNPVSLDDFEGAKVLVYFYPADDTPG
jgi:cytochrome oxidase Cu insertion factor (SCO1/SenC/PrrC family)